MGFLNGRVTALRFKVSGHAPKLFDSEHIDRLGDRAAGRQKIASADGIETGWSAGDSILDTNFTLEKNIVNDALLFELRIDTDKIPADLLRAYYDVELKALTKDNPSGFASARQKREAKQIAHERLEEEGRDGRFKKRKCIPVMWDRLTNEVLFGASSLSQVDRLCGLFEQTFGMSLECMTAGNRAYSLAEPVQRTRAVEDAACSIFVPGTTPTETYWICDDASRDFLGNEFLLWLWFQTDMLTDTFKLADDSEVALMFARILALDCPRAQTGNEAFASEGPSRLPEARRGAQAGKLPRKAGFTAVRHDQQYEFKLHAETMAIASAKLPPLPEGITGSRAKLEERITQVRSLHETLDLLYSHFLDRRLTASWVDELFEMQRWLKREERRASA